MAWALLIAAGLFEMAWAILLKQSNGLTRLVPSIGFGVTAALSLYLLARALRELPVGTAYAVWTGIGAAGTALLGILLLGEPSSALKVASIALIVAGIAGLRVAAG